jgi:cytochrome c biogenesis factor
MTIDINSEVNMTRFTTTVLALATLLVSTSALSAQNGCDIKKSKIQEQLSYAKAHGNTHRVQGLERALQNVNTYCTPNSLRDDARDEVSDRTKEVAERKADLQKAIDKGDISKIAKRERKLAEAEAELKEAQAELDALSK